MGSTTLISATLVVLMASAAMAAPQYGYYYSSCKEILAHDSTAPSGKYCIITSTGRVLSEVYCEMGLNGGGYTFIHPKDLPYLTNEEIQALYTDKYSFLMRVRRADSTQAYGVLQQMTTYQAQPLKLGLNENSGYTNPVNMNLLKRPYLYFGFLPIAQASNRDEQGVKVNGNDIKFKNCDSNPNSQLTLFPDFGEYKPSTYGYSVNYPWCTSLFNAMQQNPSHRVMPVDYFTFMELHFGGCGCYSQTDGRQSVGGTISSAIGFR